MIGYTKEKQLSRSKRLTRTQLNKYANKKLAQLWIDKDIHSCEICGATAGLTNMHRHKRRWYYDKPNEILWSYDSVIRSCLRCHMEYEYDKEATHKLFERLRG